MTDNFDLSHLSVCAYRPNGKSRLSAGADGDVNVTMGTGSEERPRKRSGRGHNAEEEVHKVVEALLRKVSRVLCRP